MMVSMSSKRGVGCSDGNDVMLILPFSDSTQRRFIDDEWEVRDVILGSSAFIGGSVLCATSSN